MADQESIPQDVLAAARREYQVLWRPGMELRPIKLCERVVGFYCPHDSSNGRRLGPIFVLPEYRRRGLIVSLYASIPGPLVACVRDDSDASIALHERAGFVRWKRYSAGWWWRRE